MLLVSALLHAEAAEVRFDGARLPELLPEDPPRPDPGPAPMAIGREVTLAPIGETAVRVVVRWRIDVPRPGAAVDWVLAGPELLVESATVDGRPGPITADD